MDGPLLTALLIARHCDLLAYEAPIAYVYFQPETLGEVVML